MSTIDEIWQSYEKLVVPADCDPIQRRVMRESFWAGAAAMFALVGHAGDKGEAAGLVAMRDLSRELKAYMASMGTPSEASEAASVIVQ